MWHEITSTDNKIIKHLCKLITQQKYKYETNQAVIVGKHVINEAMSLGIVESIFSTATYNNCDYDDANTPNNTFSKQYKKYLIGSNVLKKIDICNNQDDTIAIINTKDIIHTLNIKNQQEQYGYHGPGAQNKPIERLNEKLNDYVWQNKKILILDDIQDPGNLGTILRCALATNFSNIIITKHATDVLNYKVIRASQGLQLKLNIINNVLPEQIQEFLLHYSGKIFMTSSHNNNSIYQEDLTNNIVLIFGNEGRGVSDKITNNIPNNKFISVAIPMLNQVESLNVAMAASVCMFESLRQEMSI